MLSDETPDRMGDVIMADGWELTNFQKNPIALFGHNSSFPIGKWKNLRVVDKQLRGFLEMAPAGTSERIDEIRKLIDADILRAVSVGFRPKASRPRPESDFGVFFTKAELLETSLVSVPANPNALAVAKSLNISPATIDLVFAGKGNGNRIRRRGLTGGHADTSSLMRKGTTMSSFAQRITAAEQRLNGLRDQLNEHWSKTDETNVSDEQLKAANELTEKITQEERTLTALREAERHLGDHVRRRPRRDTTGRALVPARTRSRRSCSVTARRRRGRSAPRRRRSSPRSITWCAPAPSSCSRIGIACRSSRRCWKSTATTKCTRAVLEWSMRAATAPATTTQTGWAAELAQTLFTAFMEVLYPKAVYPRLAALGLSLNFGNNGKISIPTRATTPTIAGSFVGEGLPIPVRQGLFTSQSLTPKKDGRHHHLDPGNPGALRARRSRACCATRCRKTPRSRSTRCCSTPTRRRWFVRPASSTAWPA